MFGWFMPSKFGRGVQFDRDLEAFCGIQDFSKIGHFEAQICDVGIWPNSANISKTGQNPENKKVPEMFGWFMPSKFGRGVQFDRDLEGFFKIQDFSKIGHFEAQICDVGIRPTFPKQAKI